MTLTTKYYIAAAIVTPLYAALIATSKLPLLVAFFLGLISQIGFTIGGYFLGRRTTNDE